MSAIALEPQTELGEEELKELSAMALIQANRLLVALNKPEIVAWPKGELSGPTTPLEVALDLPAYSLDETLWYIEISNDDAVTIASSHPSFDIFDLDRNCVLTVRQAMYLLDREVAGAKEKFGITLPEELSLFLSHFCNGIYPLLLED